MAYGVKANLRAPHRFLRFGALCWLVNVNPGWGNARIQVRAMARNGRTVKSVWVDARDLGNWRAGWIPDDKYPFEDFRYPFATREEAQAWADAMSAHYASGPIRPHAAKFGRSELAADPKHHAL